MDIDFCFYLKYYKFLNSINNPNEDLKIKIIDLEKILFNYLNNKWILTVLVPEENFPFLKAGLKKRALDNFSLVIVIFFNSNFLGNNILNCFILPMQSTSIFITITEVLVSMPKGISFSLVKSFFIITGTRNSFESNGLSQSLINCSAKYFSIISSSFFEKFSINS